MIRLDKTNDEAIQHVAGFIKRQWSEDSNRYINISYNDIDKSEYRKFCLKEQNNFCCYCSRQIDDSSATELEHIIPRSKKTDEIVLGKYFEHSDILAKNIVLQDVFKSSDQIQTPPPFPHHIAYHNIVASCNGKTFEESDEFTCNRARKDDFIPPFNVMEDCITYLQDGTVLYSMDITKSEYIASLNLNKQVLKDIRRLWFLLAKSDIPFEEIQQATTESDYRRILTLCTATSRFKRATDDALRLSFSTKAKWNVFITFQYFYHFFGNPMP